MPRCICTGAHEFLSTCERARTWIQYWNGAASNYARPMDSGNGECACMRKGVSTMEPAHGWGMHMDSRRRCESNPGRGGLFNVGCDLAVEANTLIFSSLDATANTIKEVVLHGRETVGGLAFGRKMWLAPATRVSCPRRAGTGARPVLASAVRRSWRAM